MRRLRSLVIALVLVFPVSALAGGAAGDPDGVSEDLMASVPGTLDWLDSVARFLVAYFGT